MTAQPEKLATPDPVPPPPAAGSSAPARSVAAPFNAQDDAGVPELAIGGSAAVAAPEPREVPMERNLSALPKKIIFVVGRGRSGKTTFIRWLTERLIASGVTLIMADLDPTNDTFSRYIDGVSRPTDTADPIGTGKWLEALLNDAVETVRSAVIDLGGGDTTLRRLVAQLPDLTATCEAAGIGVVVFYLTGPHEEDLTPLAAMNALGFRPTASALVLNEGLMELGATRETAFARVVRHSVVRTALEHDVALLWMPRLIPAHQVEIRRLHFRAAVDGQTGQGTTPLGPFDRARVRLWLAAMEAAFAGVQSWWPT